MIRPVLCLLRPHQWVKNTFVFLPLFFGKLLLHTDCWIPSVCAFISFCFASSGIYCLNDIRDVEADRLHSEKKHRPVASGVVSKNAASCVMLICWAISLFFIILGCHTEMQSMLSALMVLVLYVGMNVAYCYKLKNVSIVDVLIISLGFVLRVVLGGLVVHVELSQWIVLMTFLLALFIAFAKRRDDVVALESTGVALRKSVSNYNLAFINQTMCVLASVTIVCYIMYTVSEEVIARLGSRYLYTTSVFVLAGIIRYLQITMVDGNSGSPTKVILGDGFILGCLLLWFVSFALFIYL